MSMESDAKETAIQKLLDTWQVSLSEDGQYDAYLDAVTDCSADATKRAVKQFCDGKVEGRNHAFVPKPPELAIVARAWDEAIAAVTASQELRKTQRIISYPIGGKPPPPSEALGPIRLEVGGIIRDVSDWSLAEKEEAIKTGTLPASRNQITTDATRAIEVKPQRFQ